MKNPNPLRTENVCADIFKNPYSPGAEVHIEAEYATREDAEKLLIWLYDYLNAQRYKK